MRRDRPKARFVANSYLINDGKLLYHIQWWREYKWSLTGVDHEFGMDYGESLDKQPIPKIFQKDTLLGGYRDWVEGTINVSTPVYYDNPVKRP